MLKRFAKSYRPRARSLRLRLLVRVMAPLLAVAVCMGGWGIWNAFEVAKEVFDRNLRAVSVAVARDVASSGGELISLDTQNLLDQASGGQVFYHVLGEDGAYVAGFGYPPRAANVDLGRGDIPQLFDSTHLGAPVRAASLTQLVDAGGLEGFARITVWQKQAVRTRFAINQALLTLGTISLLVAAVMAIVWLSVNSGLAPLNRLNSSVARRSPEDLRPIAYAAPQEVKPLVDTLNSLFGEVHASIEARDRFIGNAAHQLRNPISAVRALAESALNARSPEEMRRRVAKTVAEAQHTTHLAEQLLTIERLVHAPDQIQIQRFDAERVLFDVSTRFGDRVLDRGIDFSLSGAGDGTMIDGDPVLFAEAIENLLDNALRHGGAALSSITIDLVKDPTDLRVGVEDDGQGIAPADRDVVFERFSQLDFGTGSGLGLAIVREIAATHGGNVAVLDAANGPGTRFELTIPLSVAASDRPRIS